MKTLKDFSVTGKRVLVRCDFNVPQDENGKILDDYRIRQTVPTIDYLLENNAKVVLMSHMGDPAGKVEQSLRLNNVAERLSKILKKKVIKIDDCIGEQAKEKADNLKSGEILLLENLRFHKEETLSTSSGQAENEFAKNLSFLGDIYVNDAFGVCHRNNASVSLLPKILPSCAGLLLEKEIISLQKVMQNPQKPMISIIGGTKVETKAKFINNASRVSNYVLISGLIAKEVKEKDIKFDFPEKIVIPYGQLDALDIDKETIKNFKEKIKEAKTVLWNGPFGKFEEKKYEKGTLEIAKAIVKSKAFSVVGGGETVEFLQKQGMIDKFNHVSTGGGAMLAYLSGEKLPGIEALG